MSDDVLIQNTGDIKNIIDTTFKTNTLISTALESSITSGVSSLERNKNLYFKTVGNKLFLKFIGVDYEGLLQSLHKNKKVK